MFVIVGDDTAGNTLLVACGTKSGAKYRKGITSSRGFWGSYRPHWDDCSGSNNFIRQMDLRSERRQGRVHKVKLHIPVIK